MKVGDDENRRRTEQSDRRQQERREEVRREKDRRFSELLNKRDNADKKPGRDERARKLREGTAQQDRSRREARRLERRFGEGRPRKTDRHGEPSRRTDRREQTRSAQRGDADRTRQEADTKRSGTAPDCPDADHGPSGRPDATPADAVERRSGSVDKSEEDEASEVRRSGRSGSAEDSQRCSAPLEVVARRVLNAVRVGDGQTSRQVMFLDVTVPQRGDVRIRLRRDGGGGFELRMRADNDALARTLQRGSGELRDRAAQQGVQFSSIRVVR